MQSSIWVQLDLATSGRGGIGIFIGICIISAAFGIADAHVEGGMIGDLSLMCPEFIQVSCCFFPPSFSFCFTDDISQAFLAGFGASGTLSSGLRLITKAAFENSKNGLRKGASMS